MAKQVRVEVVPTLASGAGKALGAAIGAAAGGHGAGGFAGIAGAVGGAAGIPGAEAIKPIFDIMASFVSKANPAILEQMGAAFEDMQAVIGQALVPLFQQLVPLFRGFADLVANLVPIGNEMKAIFSAFQPVFNALNEVMKELGTALAPLVTAVTSVAGVIAKSLAPIFITIAKVTAQSVVAFAPLIEMIAQLATNTGVLEVVLGLIAKVAEMMGGALVTALQLVIKAITDLWNYVVEEFPKVAKTLGIKKLEGPSLGRGRSSFGAAARHAQYSSIESLGANLAQAGFGGGGGPEQQTAEATKSAAETLKELLQTAREQRIILPGFTGNY